MKNRKKIFLGIILVAVILFIGLYFVYHYSEPNILSSKDKKWISENNKQVVSIGIINDIPLYSKDGEGVVFEFLDYVTLQSTIDFNKVTYLKDNQTSKNSYRFEIVDGATKLNSNQLLFYTDSYVLISKQDKVINSINELTGLSIGVLKDDSANISYYFQ